MMALRTALPGRESASKVPLTSVFVSRTTRVVSRICENLVQSLFRQATCHPLLAHPIREP